MCSFVGVKHCTLTFSGREDLERLGGGTETLSRTGLGGRGWRTIGRRGTVEPRESKHVDNH